MTRIPAAHVPARPSINYSDTPEVSLIGGSGPLSRRVGYRKDRTKFRVKSLAFPMIAEVGDEDNGTRSATDQHGLPWSCRTCTFVNHGELLTCEMCHTPANGGSVIDNPIEASWEHVSINSVRALHKLPDAASPTSGLDGDWPSLGEAIHSFVECEVSSVGSSWLDIDVEGGIVEDDCGAYIVTGMKDPATQASQTWAARARDVAAQGPAAAIPAAGVLAPRLQSAQPKKQEKDREVGMVDDDNWELDRLEGRRLQPHFARGSTQRRRGRC